MGFIFGDDREKDREPGWFDILFGSPSRKSTDRESDDDRTVDFADGLDSVDMVDEMDDLDIEVDDLSSDEYYTGKNEGYLKFDIDAEDLIAAFLESETCGYLEMMGSQVEEYADGLEGCVCVAVYISGENMVIVMGAGVNNAPDYLDEFCGDLGIASPSKLESNAMIAQAICDYVDDTLGSMLSSFAALATSSDF